MNSNGEHEFGERLRWSHRMHDLPLWREAYEQAFPGCVMQTCSDDGEHQRAGIDRGLLLKNGKCLWTDEKAREPLPDRPWPYQDILLEYVSNDRTRALGWVVKKLLADYIAYAILQTGQCFLLPVIQLQQAWLRHGDFWLKKYGHKSAPNPGYRTLSCPVPIDVLFAAIGSCLRVRCQPMSFEQLSLFVQEHAA